jgi:hypothetical protein
MLFLMFIAPGSCWKVCVRTSCVCACVRVCVCACVRVRRTELAERAAARVKAAQVSAAPHMCSGGPTPNTQTDAHTLPHTHPKLCNTPFGSAALRRVGAHPNTVCLSYVSPALYRAGDAPVRSRGQGILPR